MLDSRRCQRCKRPIGWCVCWGRPRPYRFMGLTRVTSSLGLDGVLTVSIHQHDYSPPTMLPVPRKMCTRCDRPVDQCVCRWRPLTSFNILNYPNENPEVRVMCRRCGRWWDDCICRLGPSSWTTFGISDNEAATSIDTIANDLPASQEKDLPDRLLIRSLFARECCKVFGRYWLECKDDGDATLDGARKASNSPADSDDKMAQESSSSTEMNILLLELTNVPPYGYCKVCNKPWPICICIGGPTRSIKSPQYLNGAPLGSLEEFGNGCPTMLEELPYYRLYDITWTDCQHKGSPRYPVDTPKILEGEPEDMYDERAVCKRCYTYRRWLWCGSTSLHTYKGVLPEKSTKHLGPSREPRWCPRCGRHYSSCRCGPRWTLLATTGATSGLSPQHTGASQEPAVCKSFGSWSWTYTCNKPTDSRPDTDVNNAPSDIINECSFDEFNFCRRCGHHKMRCSCTNSSLKFGVLLSKVLLWATKMALPIMKLRAFSL